MNTKRMITIAKLYLMSLFGKNHKKADMLRKSGLFIEYGGGGGIGIQTGFRPIQSLYQLVTMLQLLQMYDFMSMTK